MEKEYYLKLRNKYLPENLRIIFIAESPPASGRYFYDETGSTSEPGNCGPIPFKRSTLTANH